MKLVKKCLIEFNNKYTNHIKNNEVDDNKQLRFTLLDMQKFAKKYHKQKLTLTDVVSSAFLVQHKETLINHGLFSTREKAENYINKNTDLFGIQEVKIA